MKKDPLLMIAALILAGLNMRPLMTSVSPLLEQLRESMGLSSLAASLLPAIPMMMMGAIALVSAPLLQRIPLRRLLCSGLALLVLALASRFFIAQGAWLVWSTVPGGIGIGIVQMAMPGLIRQRFTQRSAMITGLWAAALMGGGGLGAALTPWISAHLGWQGALSSWSVPALLAVMLWWRIPAASPSRQTSGVMPSIWRNTRAWTLALSFGLVNGGYAICVAWLPDFYHQQGWSAQAGGGLLGVMIACQVAGALVFPLLVRGGGQATAASADAGTSALRVNRPAGGTALPSLAVGRDSGRWPGRRISSCPGAGAGPPRASSGRGASGGIHAGRRLYYCGQYAVSCRAIACAYRPLFLYLAVAGERNGHADRP